MLKHKNIDRICCLILAAVIAITCLFIGAAATGLVEENRLMGYENRLFDQSQVHTIDIVMDDWDAFLETCTQEVYAACTLVIDGEKYGNVAIRGKGNTSLTSVASYGNNRYSFKVEFDHYQSGSYHGLDKLSLNNLIQDATYLKDYLSYTLMGKMGVASPLCSFVQINVNGEPWGLYLAVEGVEESFLQRNYGKEIGDLYKPDSLSFGGGQGNGKNFSFSNLNQNGEMFNQGSSQQPALPNANMQENQGFDPSSMFGDGMQPPEGFDPSSMFGDGMQPPEMPEGDSTTNMGFGGIGPRGGMGSNDVKLIYTDDDPSSYSNIFNNAKSDITQADQQRLISSLKALNEGDTSVVDTDAVTRYLAVHNFLCNDDSYTGMMVHNYYLYEDDGVMSMIPWDYNLAMGGFSAGQKKNGGATSTVNAPIDSPVSSGEVSSRPMVAWIFNSEETLDSYHDVYQAFITDVFASGWFEGEFDRVISMISPYVARDTNGFYSYDEFQLAADTLRMFCLKRAESVQGQLNGTVPATSTAQNGSAALIDASDIDLSTMGGMGAGMGGFGVGNMERNVRGDTRKEFGQGMTPPSSNATDNPPANPAGENSSIQPPENPTASGGSQEMQTGQSAADARPSMPLPPNDAAASLTDESKAVGSTTGDSDKAAAPSQANKENRPATAKKQQMPQMQAQPTQDTSTVPLMAGSVILLFAAILFVGRYRSNLP